MPDASAIIPTKDVVEGTRPKPKYQWFTDCPQQWFIPIVRGGDLVKIIHGVDGWYVDENFEFQPEDATHQRVITPLRAIIGREFVGVPTIQGMFVQEFAWNKFWRKGGESPVYEVTAHKPELVYRFPFEAQYPLVFGGIEVIGQETKDEEEAEESALVPVTFEVTVRIRMRRPKVALMTNNDWFGSVLTPKMQQAIKDFAGNKTYENLIRKARSGVSNEFETYIMTNFRDDILLHAGVEIIDISITDIKPHKAFEDALLKLAEAKRTALAEIELAKGRKQAKVLEGQGLKEYEQAVGEGKAAAAAAQRNAVGETNWGKHIKWDGVKNSKLTTLLEEKGEASVLIGTDGRPIS